MLEEELGSELVAAGDVELGVHGLDVILCGVARDPQSSGYLFGGQAAGE
jgi:hypothetical protein